MQKRLVFLIVLILLFSSISYSDEYSYPQGYSESYGYEYSEEFDDFPEEDYEKYKEYKEHRKEGMDFPEDFKGPGGCKSREECMKYCKEHEDECRRMMENKEQFGMRNFEGKGFPQPPMRQMMMQPMMPKMQPMMFIPEKMDPVEMIMHKIFEKAKDMNPKEFMQYCPDAEKLVDEAIKRLKEQGIELKASCDELKEYLDKCKDHSNQCSKIKEHMFFGEEDAECDNLNEETLFNKCMERHKEFSKGKDFMTEECKKNFERFKESNHMCMSQETCDEQEFLNKCRQDQEQRCNELAQQYLWSQENIDQCINSNDCNTAWSFQKNNCEIKHETCNEEKFVNDCIERSSEGFETASAQIEENCRMQASKMLHEIKQACESNSKMYNECLERSSQMCSKMEEAISQCSSITEDQIIAKMKEHAKFMCEMHEKMKFRMDEEGMEGVMAKMMMIREEMPEDMRMMMDIETKKLNEINKEIEEKKEEGGGIFKEILKLLGILSKKEKERAAKLKEKAQGIQESIDRLSELSNQVSDPDVKAALLLQIEKLKEEKDELSEMAKEEGLLTGFVVFIKNFEL